jgi:hypothetical protein
MASVITERVESTVRDPEKFESDPNSTSSFSGAVFLGRQAARGARQLKGCCRTLILMGDWCVSG